MSNAQQSNKLPPSLIEQAIYIVRELDVPVDKPTPHDYGRLVSNLALLKMNATHDEHFPTRWEALIAHVMYPDYNAFPEALFLSAPEDMLPYKSLLQAIDHICDNYGE